MTGTCGSTLQVMLLALQSSLVAYEMELHPAKSILVIIHCVPILDKL